MAEELQVNEQTEDVNQVDDQESEADAELKTFTEEQVNKLIANRLAREKKNHEKEIEQAIEDTKKEAKRLSELSKEERDSEEHDKLKQELAESKARLARMELESDTIENLKEEGLPIEFKSFLIAENAENTLENINLFKPIFLDAVQAEVEKRLKGRTPKGSNTVTAKVDKKDTQAKMAEYASKQRII
ncbi:DUF4355 domain-containing protein [Anaerococcus sp. DFU013_CI05]|uniref:DUF4355 domain-containing protein n=1 Tax=Anaerococcus sp. AH8042_DFU013_CI05 TaxID=3385202 RepID=UPI003A521BB9